MDTSDIGGMADYQLIGDAFGYHSGYGSASGQQPGSGQSGQGQPPGLGVGGNTMPPGSGLSGLSGPQGSAAQAYHQLQATAQHASRVGASGYPPQSGDPLMSHKIHSQYPNYGSAGQGLGGGVRGQYPTDPRYAALQSSHGMSDYNSAMSQSHLQSGQPPIGSGYGQQSLMGQPYGGQRMHTPGLTPNRQPPTGAPMHGMPSHYSSSYPSGPPPTQTGYHSHPTPGSDMWSGGGVPHMQQSSTYPGYPGSGPVGPVGSGGGSGGRAGEGAGSGGSSSSQSSSLHSVGSHPRGGPQSQYVSHSEYSAMHPNEQQRQYYPRPASGGGPTQSQQSMTAHIPSDGSTLPYPTPSQGPYISSTGSQQQQSTPSRGSHSGGISGSVPRQQYLGYNTPSLQSQPPSQQQQQPPQQPNQSQSSGAPMPRYPHQQYSGYPQPAASYGESSAQSRLSPYPLSQQQSGPTGPNSPQFRPGFPSSGGSQVLSSLSPRRPTTTPPAGSPMPPSSHTPDRSSATTATSQASSHQSSFPISPGANHLSSPVQGMSPGSSVPSTPSSLQQLEQMVMPHLGGPGSGGVGTGGSNSGNSASKSSIPVSTNTSSSSSSSSFYGSVGPNTPSGGTGGAGGVGAPPSPQSSVGPQRTGGVGPQASIYSHYGTPGTGGGMASNQSQYPYHQQQQQYQQNNSHWTGTQPNPMGGTAVSQQSSSSSAVTSLTNTHSMSGSGSGGIGLPPQSSQTPTHRQSSHSPTVASNSSSPMSNVSKTEAQNNNTISGQYVNSYGSEMNSVVSANTEQNFSQSFSRSTSSSTNSSTPPSSSSSSSSQPIQSGYSVSQSTGNTGSASFDSSVIKAQHKQQQQTGQTSQNDTQQQSQTPQSQSHNSGGGGGGPTLGSPSHQHMFDSIKSPNASTPRPLSDSLNNDSQQQQQQSNQNPSDRTTQQQHMMGSHPSPGVGHHPAYHPMMHNHPHSHQPSYPQQQQMSNYGNSYDMNYDMNAVAGDMSESSGMRGYGDHDSGMMYDNYGMESMVPPQMGEYQHRDSGGDYGPIDPYSTNFDDSFGEPPTKRKGKGRPKKDPNEPKKERKPRQPRAPRGTGRGRGRGKQNNLGDRMPPMPASQMMGPPDYDPNNYGMPPESMDLYSHEMYGQPMPPTQQSGPLVGPPHQSQQPIPSMPPMSGQTPHSMAPLPPLPPVQQHMQFQHQQHMQSQAVLVPPTQASAVPLGPPPPQPPQQTTTPSQSPPPIPPQQPQQNNNCQQSMQTHSTLPPTLEAQPQQQHENSHSILSPSGAVTPVPISIPPPLPATGPVAPIPSLPPLEPLQPLPAAVQHNIMSPSVPSVPTLVEQPVIPSIIEKPLESEHNLYDENFLDQTTISDNNNLNDTTMISMPTEEETSISMAVVSDGDMYCTTPPRQMSPCPPPTTDNVIPEPKLDSYEFEPEVEAEQTEQNQTQPEIPLQQVSVPPTVTTPVKEPKPKKAKKRKPKKDLIEPEVEVTATGEDIVVPEGEPKPPKVKKVKKRKKKQQPEEETELVVEQPSEDIVDESTKVSQTTDLDDATQESSICDSSAIESSTGKSGSAAKKSKSRSRSKPKIKNRSPKKKLPKLALKFSKNKKKRRLGSSGSPDHSDLERTPPPSPDDTETGIQKRRSARNTKRQKYTDDIELDLSEDDDTGNKKDGLGGVLTPLLDSSGKPVGDGQVLSVVANINEDTMIVEKIMTSRMAQRELEYDAIELSDPNPKPQTIEVEEYFVKYKNLSYFHCEWRTEEELEKGDRRVGQKIKRFKQKRDTMNMFDFLDEEPYNPDYIEVDRILDVNEIEEIYEPIVEELDTKQESKPVKEESVVSKVTTDSTETTDEMEVTEPSSEPTKPDDIESQITTDSQTNDETDKTEPNSAESSVVPNDSEKTDISADISDNNDTKDSKCEESVEKEDDIKPEIDDNNTNEDDNNEIKTEIKSEDIVKSETKDESMDTNDENESKDSKVSKQTKTADKTKTKSESEEQIEAKPKKSSAPLTRKVKHYLVKWRALTYEDSTWELEDDLDPIKVEQFWKFRKPPPKSEWKPKRRPKASDWKKVEESPVYKAGNTLREYQLEGVNWLSYCWYNGQNCILADEMGLGKTIQSLAFVNEIVKYGIKGPFLVIAPLSTIGNWQREFETWTDLNVITYHGSSASRNMLQEYEMYYKNEKNERINGIYKFQVMITTFEVVLTDCLELREITWRTCVIDEAHRLKNRNCKLLEGLRLLDMEHRVLLTGTPLQNNVEELFSLLNFLEPTQFTSNESFMLEFGDLKTEAQVDKLKAILKPMMLRRLKEDVEKSLAPKEETIVEVELTNVQKKYYRAILERNFQFLSKGGTNANIPNLMNTMMELRKCCIHPFLINGAEDQIVMEYRQQHSPDEGTSVNAMVNASGKLVLIDKLLPRLKDNGHRVLIFSQMVRCLDILEDYMVQRRYPYERIDGRVRGNLRQAAIDRFCKPDSDRFVFLLCTRAGGLGINLTAADTVIIFDSDWNPQNDLQAQARCHRIGQSKAVKVYRLICRNTYEREMFDKASLKLGLDRAVLQSMNTSKANSSDGPLSKKEIEDLLRKGAYGALMEDDNAGDKFCEEDIEQILQRRTQTVIIESEGKGSTFSKASFASSNNRSDIEIDDPNFWEKWAKKANFDIDELKGRNELIVQEPRRRTQTKRFGADDAVLDMSELETSDEDDDSVSMRTRGGRNSRLPKGKKCKKGRGGGYERERDEDYMQEFGPGNWTRAECYKVEKGLLTFGWGRWNECLVMGNFRRQLTRLDVEQISRVLLLFALQNYKGDEKIKAFIWDLITPNEDGEHRVHRNHSGLSAPVPRGRKNKKMKKTVGEELELSDWAKDEKFNPEYLLTDDMYRKHLHRHANKILLRVRLLYYLKHEIIGDLHEQVFRGISARDIPIPSPVADGDPPAHWWDEEADKSLVVGVYKHGYDRFNLMRQDPALCFLQRCGPPDGAALLAEINADDDLGKTLDDDDEPETPATPATPLSQTDGDISDSKKGKNEKSDSVTKTVSTPDSTLDSTSETVQSTGESGALLPFPSAADMNHRLRRIVTSYQRNFKKQEAKLAQRARHQQRLERLERFEAAIKERELKKRDLAQKKWSRREEADFYRVISSFGVEYFKDEDRYDWTRFRSFGKLERKMDETLTEYFKAFYAMCKRVNGRRLTEEEENLPISVDPISEERASRCLARIDLLSKIREEILTHPELDERLQLCQHSMDLPDWWLCGKHDKDLLVGAAKYGLNRLDFNLVNDPELCFAELFKQIEEMKANEEKCEKSVELSEEKVEPKIETNETDIKPETDSQKESENLTENETDIDVNPAEVDKSLEKPKQLEDISEAMDVTKDDKTDTKPDESVEKVAEEVNEKVDSKPEPKDSEDNETENKSNESDVKESEEKEVKTETTDDSKNELNVNQIKEETKESIEKTETSVGEEKPIDENKDKADSPKIESKTEDNSEKESEMTEKISDSEEQKPDSKTNASEMEIDSNEDKNIEDKDLSEKQIDSKEKEPEEDDKQKESKESDINPTDETKDNPKTPTTVENKESDEPMECDDNEKSELKPKIEENEENPDKNSKDDEEDKLKSDLTADDDKKSVSTEDSVVKTEETTENIDKEMSEIKTESESVASVVNEKEVSVTPSSTPQLTQLKTFPRFPKDRVLQMRLEQICHTVEKNEWPSLRHSFFSLLTGPHQSTPSVATADSSPRPISPCSGLSSASREPTPHPTPDHTPRREALSPLPEFFYADNSASMNESASRRRRRRRRRFEVEAERQKLRNLLSQTIEQTQQQHQQLMNSQQLSQQQQQQSSNNSNNKNKQTSLLSGSSSQFLPPLFSLPFANLRSAIRDELMTDEKTASLLLGSTLQSSLAAAAAASAQQQQQSSSGANNSSKSSQSSKGGPPPAHQNSGSARNPPSLGTLDLTGRFKSSSVVSKMVTPPAPAHKTRSSDNSGSVSASSGGRDNATSERHERQSGRGEDVLDLSSGAPSKRTRAHSPSKRMSSSSAHLLAQQSAPPATPPPPVASHTSLPSKRSSRKIGSRIDALALNLQAKKMMEEKKTDPKPEPKLESSSLSSLSSLEKRQATHFMEELQKHSALLAGKTPPMAHSKSSSSLSSSKSGMNDSPVSLLGTTSKSNAHSNPFGALDASKLPPSKATEASTIAEQVAIIRQNLRNLFEDHPEFIAQNPSMASMVAASAANVFNPNLNMNSISSIPANTELLELPDSRRSRSRRSRVDPTQLDMQHLTGEENVSVINRTTGKKITGSKAPPLKHLAEWLDKNPKFDVDPKWSPIVNKEKAATFKTPTSTAPSVGVRTRTSDKRSSNSSSSSLTALAANLLNNSSANSLNSISMSGSDTRSSNTSSNSSSRRQTAASLLASGYGNSFGNTAVTSSSLSYPSTAALNSFNANLLAAGFPSMKMFLDQTSGGMTSPSMTTTASKSSSGSTSGSTTTTTTSSSSSGPPMFFPFGGLAGMGLGNPLFGFPSFNLPGLTPSSSALTSTTFSSNDHKNKDNNNSDNSSTNNEKQSKSGSGGKSSSSSKSSSKSNSNLNSSGLLGSSAAAAAALGAGSLPFLYPSPNFLYNPLSLSGFSGLSGSPFGFMNGLGGLSTASAMSGLSATTNSSMSTNSSSLTTTSHSKSSHSKSSSGKSSSKSSSSAALAAAHHNMLSSAAAERMLSSAAAERMLSSAISSNAPSGLSLASSLLASAGVHPSSAAAAAAIGGDSDDDSLKSLMGNDDEDDLNGDYDDKDINDGSDFEPESKSATNKKKTPSSHRSSKDLNKTKTKGNSNSTSNSKVSPN